MADSLTAVRDSMTKVRVAALPPGGRPIFDGSGSFIGYTPANPAAPPPVGPPAIPTPTAIAPAAIPDYVPPIGVGALRTDADGRLWILTKPTKVRPGGQV